MNFKSFVRRKNENIFDNNFEIINNANSNFLTTFQAV